MSERRIPPAGDPFYAAAASLAARRTGPTRHHRCDEAFIEVLEEDFGIAAFALNASFMGVPREPKKGAIALCEWASSVAPEDPARALLSWARKNGRGTFRRPDDDAGDASGRS